MNRWIVWLTSVAFFLMTFTVTADPASNVRAGMLISGSIVVAPDGSVQSYALDQQKKIPAVVLNLIGKTVPAWRFEPITLDGQPIAATSAMDLRIIAKKNQDGGYSFSISGASFSQISEEQQIAFAQHKIPTYPPIAVKNHISGTVYLMLRINPQGTVVDGFAARVDLDTSPTYGPIEYEMTRWRAVLSSSALTAARTWKFPAKKPSGNADGDWFAVTPINYHLSELGERPDMYGKWDVYVPGPMQPSPWPDAAKMAYKSLDAVPAGSFALDASQLHLTTPLGGS